MGNSQFDYRFSFLFYRTTHIQCEL